MANRLGRLVFTVALLCAAAPPSADAAPPPSCSMPRNVTPVANGPIIVTLNPSTNWQPRGGNVLVEISSNDPSLNGLHYLACFTWDNIDPATFASGAPLTKLHPNDQDATPGKTDHGLVREGDWMNGFIELRPSSRYGVVDLGVSVPSLPATDSSIASRWRGDDPSTGLGLVPVSHLRIIGYDKDNNVLADAVRPIGITSIKLALAIAVATLALALVTIHTLVGTQFSRSARGRLSLDWLLGLSRMPDGRASLSGFQVLIWTLVIAGGSVYVMALSGNLVDVPPGALTVLGIAGATKLLASNADGKAEKEAARTAQAYPSAPRQPAYEGDDQPQTRCDPEPQPPVAGPVQQIRDPCWQDLIFDPGTQSPNVSRMQMLMFTVISAAFVMTQVLNYYVIPDIPTGYQILMGISNGIYVGRKFTG